MPSGVLAELAVAGAGDAGGSDDCATTPLATRSATTIGKFGVTRNGGAWRESRTMGDRGIAASERVDDVATTGPPATVVAMAHRRSPHWLSALVALLFAVTSKAAPPQTPRTPDKAQEPAKSSGKDATKAPPPARAKTSGAVSILFVGNSYTSFHELPVLVRALGRAQKPPRALEITAVTPGGCTLEQHWLATGADAPRTLLQDRRFDFVVLQEQSRRPLDDAARLHEFAAKFAALAHDRKTTPVWYATWARAATPDEQPRLTLEYQRAQQAGGGLLAPVGEAWSKLLAEPKPLPLHEADGSHPNVAGSYVAACVLFATMCGGDVTKFPDKLVERGDDGKERVLVDLPAAEGKRLRAAAALAMAAPRSEPTAPKAAPSKPERR